jgi:hypothetical protein
MRGSVEMRRWCDTERRLIVGHWALESDASPMATRGSGSRDL